jgi:hypothetical protein
MAVSGRIDAPESARSTTAMSEGAVATITLASDAVV